MRAIISFLFLNILVILTPLRAQTGVCDYFRGIPNTECSESGDRATVTIHSCRTIRFEFNFGDTDNPLVITVDGQRFDATDINDIYAYGALLEDICGAVSFSGGAPVGSPIDPVG